MEFRQPLQQQSTITTSRRQPSSRKRGPLTRNSLSARKRPRKRILNRENVNPNADCELETPPLTTVATPSHHAHKHRPASGTTTLTNIPRYDIISSTPITKATPNTTPRGSFLTTPTKAGSSSLLLSNWGLPERVLSQYSQRGITTMFEWQAECLKLGNVLSGGNLVYSAPTSAGKTLVAELLALKCVLEAKKKVIIILPFVSVAHEKVNYLRSVFEPQGVRVGGFMGNQSPAGGFTAVDIAICTIEKANSLFNRMLEERTTSSLGVVIVDELHMIGDEHRGYLLELMLTKLMYVGRASQSGGGGGGVQIIGMSATLPNIAVLARWLGAELYQTDFRPTPLQEMAKIGATLYDTDLKKLREFDPSESLPGDEDDILTICQERVIKGHSVLIFCPTKAWCENLASTLAEARARLAEYNDSGEGMESRGGQGPSVLDRRALVGVCEQLRRTQVGLDRVLEKTVPNGVAFHHAGLTFEEREIVEGAFRQTLVKVLVATSTLSSGVNLPARLVIVRTPFFQRSLLDVLTYKQMVGRAGRKGVDTLGESILMCKPSERAKVVGMFKSSPKCIRSCLCAQAAGSRVTRKSVSSTSGLAVLKRALLEIVASGVATTRDEIWLYASCTLYFAELELDGKSSSPGQKEVSSLNGHLDATLSFLLQNDFIFTKIKPPNLQVDAPVPVEELCPTQLGVATVASSLSPDEALVVFGELRKARRNFVLENELHLIYLVTPVYIQAQWPNIDWYKYLCLWERLPADMRHVSDTLGVRESFLAQAVQGHIPERTETQREAHRLHRRFFTALALHDLVHEVPIRRVARQYGATKGLLQTLQSAAGTFAGMVTAFCAKLGWANLELLVAQFQNRLTFGVERELCDLVKISLLNGFRARVLYNAGYHTLAALATANAALVETCLRNAVPFKSYKLAGGGEDREGVEVRGNTCNTWCARLRKGMTETEAAFAIVSEARTILSKDLNVPLSAWDRQQQQCLPSPLEVRRLEIGSGVQSSALGQNQGPVTVSIKVSERATCLESDSHSTNVNSANLRPAQQRSDSHISNLILANLQQQSGSHVSDLDPANLCPALKTAAQPPYSNFTPVSALLQAPPPCDPPGTGSATMRTNDQTSPCPAPSGARRSFVHFEDLSPISVLGTPSNQSGELAFNNLVTPEIVPEARELSFELLGNSKSDLSLDSLPLTIPDSLPCSADVSMSFSFHTLAMIDAVCDAAKVSSEGGVKGSEGITSEPEVGSDGVVQKSPLHGVDNDLSREVLGRSGGGEELVIEQTPLKSLQGRKNVPKTPSLEDQGNDLQPFLDDRSNNLHQNGGTGLRVEDTPLGLLRSSKTVPETPSSLQLSGLRELSSLCSSQLSQSGVTVINVTSNRVLFDTFISECLGQRSVAISVARARVDQSDGIGSIIVRSKCSAGIPLPPLNSEQVVGVAFCWGGMDVYYVSLCQDTHPSREKGGGVAPQEAEPPSCVSLAERVDAVQKLFQLANSGTGWGKLIGYDLKKHVKSLALSCGAVPACVTSDPIVASWMLDPDAKEKTIHRMVLQYLPDEPLLSECEEYEEVPLSSLATGGGGGDPEMQAAAEAILAYMLAGKLEVLLEAESLLDAYLTLEMPSLLVLAKIELNGIGFSPEECTNQRDVLQRRVSELEQEAYGIAGHTFSLTSPEDVSSVLFRELGIPFPGKQKTLGTNTRITRRRAQHLSTAKDVLEKIRVLNPLPGVILEWRRISATMSKTVYPLLKDAVVHDALDSFRIHACVQIHTSTGRVSVAEPSLQMVPKEYDIGRSTSSSIPAAPALLSDSQYLEAHNTEHTSDTEHAARPSSVCMRNVFQPFPGALFLTADYSQLELRILAHMSGDAKLRGILNRRLGDVFKMIAGEWLGVPASSVSDQQRQEAKQICYGMVYGIGPKALAEQLGVTDNEASQFMEQFRSKYPTMKRFISKTIQDCRDVGHVTTLLGRKRFLPAIHAAEVHARSQAERQAVNTTIQGSAADLVKTAMVNIDRKLAAQYSTCLLPSVGDAGGRPAAYLVLQLHDELLYEVTREHLGEVAELVRHEMENALKLSVRFPVKLKVGPAWGSLELTEF